jgi:HSP20 family molecular chaperone IbpA
MTFSERTLDFPVKYLILNGGARNKPASEEEEEFMNLLARRDHECPVELEHAFPGVEEFFRNVFAPGTPELLHRHNHWGPVHDLQVGEKTVTLQLSCPGHKAEDFDVEITGNMISVKTCCNCQAEQEKAQHSYMFKERSCMTFEETLHLPVKVIGAEAKAEYEHGVLHITIPRELKKECAVRTIKVNCPKCKGENK